MPSLSSFVNQGSLFGSNSQFARLERQARSVNSRASRVRRITGGNAAAVQMAMVGLEDAVLMLSRTAPAAMRGARKGIKEGLEEFRKEARSEIRAWTTRPGYTRTGETERSVRLGVDRRGAWVGYGGVKNRRRSTADGRPIYVPGRLHELGGRHPLFADINQARSEWGKWYDQPRRPVLIPLAARGRAKAHGLVRDRLINEVGRVVG